MEAPAEKGMITVPSAHGVKETIDRLDRLLNEKGMTVFARVDHSAGAIKVGMTLRPTELLIFGNPQVGTPLMERNQTAGIDLPQKALAWEDEQGQVWLSYNDPNYLAVRHGITDCSDLIGKIEAALKNFTSGATAR